jgi:hypothetical protein
VSLCDSCNVAQGRGFETQSEPTSACGAGIVELARQCTHVLHTASQPPVSLVPYGSCRSYSSWPMAHRCGGSALPRQLIRVPTRHTYSPTHQFNNKHDTAQAGGNTKRWLCFKHTLTSSSTETPEMQLADTPRGRDALARGEPDALPQAGLAGVGNWRSDYI